MATQFEGMSDASSFRRMAAAMWKNPSDPTIYGSMDVDVTETLAEIARFRERTGLKLSITHVVTRAVAQAFRNNPELNAKVRYWGKLERRKSVDLFLSVATEGGKDLSGARIDDADALDLAGLIAALEGKARGIRDGKDKAFEKSRGLFKKAPWWILRPLLALIDLFSNELHLHLPSQGMPRDPFGSALITNVGMFGIDTAFAPFVPMGRCPMLLLITEVKERPCVVDGRVVPRSVLRLCATFDHRIIDGFSAGKLAREIRGLIEKPEGLEAPAAAPMPLSA
jgi:pyruvate/2-oxoglutarate dehydrogenase complex dihydrolipoamide acyltransferase (E2) component